MPALTDGAYTLFESIACMQYLVDKYDTEHKLSFPHGSVEYYESLSWLAFHTGGIGPNLGSAFYYQTMANARCDYAIGRFMNETRRLFSILDKRLATRQWLVGDKYSIVDIAHCSWVRGHYMVKIDLDEYPNLKAWCSKIETREAVKRGIEAIPGRSREESEKRFDEVGARYDALV
jgi:glutathione S-transferase